MSWLDPEVDIYRRGSVLVVTVYVLEHHLPTRSGNTSHFEFDLRYRAHLPPEFRVPCLEIDYWGPTCKEIVVLGLRNHERGELVSGRQWLGPNAGWDDRFRYSFQASRPERSAGRMLYNYAGYDLFLTVVL